MIKYASLFSGIGGFELGIQAASNQIGIKTECVFASEFDPESKAKDINKQPARIIYNKNFGEYPHGDITKINASDVPDCDLIVGGFPCQSFSIAGKRRGFEDCKGTLFFEIMRIAQVKRPSLLFLENVRGLLSHDAGRTFKTMLRTMDDMGYDAEWQVFNSKNHGVPQNRERVFIIGHLRGAGTQPIFPITKNGESVNEIQEQHTNCLTTRYEGAQATGSYIIEGEQYAQALTEARTDEAKEIRRKTKDRDFSPRRGKKLVPRNDGMANCITSGQSKEQLIQIAGCLTGGGHSGGLHSSMTASNTGHGIRRLTPIECERLMGFPDDFTAGVADTNRYRCIGNSVTVPVVADIMQKILKTMV